MSSGKKIVLNEQKDAVSIVSEDGSIVVEWIPVAFLTHFPQLFLGATAVLTEMSESSRKRQPAAFLASVVQKMTKEAGVLPQEIGKLLAQAGLLGGEHS